MKRKLNFRYFIGLFLSILMIAAAAIPITKNVVEATSATTYTRTRNADGFEVRCQDGYLPQTTYDRLGLNKPADMVIDTVIEGGKEVEYGYILNTADILTGSFIIKFRLDDVVNTVQKIQLKGVLDYISSPSGLWIQTTTVNGVTRKEMFIADSSATYKEIIQPTPADEALKLGSYEYIYNGLIYIIPFDSTGTQLLFEQYEFRHEPTQDVSRNDYHLYELITVTNINDLKNYESRRIPTAANFADKNLNANNEVVSYNMIACKIGEVCEERIVPLGQYKMKEASFGQKTNFKPSKLAVDKAGNIFIASSGTSEGMIQLSYTGDFISFFVVNTASYNFLYQLIKNFGTKEQLSKLNVTPPKAFSNVFVDHNNLVYSVTSEGSTLFDKYSTGGKSILENIITANGSVAVADSFVTKDGLIFLVLNSGMIYVCAPTGQIIFYFGLDEKSATTDIVGFFKNLSSVMVDKNNNIWVVDSESNYLQTFTPTDYSKNIFNAIISFNNQKYEESRNSWEEVLRYDSLSVLANDGLGKAYYYDYNFEESLKYFTVSKNRMLYSNVFWELRNDFLQDNLAVIIIVVVGVIVVLVGLGILFKKNKKLSQVKEKVKGVRKTRVFKDLTVGFRLIIKPNDTFYEMKTHKRGSIFGATIYYILAIAAFLLNTYGYALPFQYVSANTLNPSTVLFAMVGLLAVFIICNYLVSAINEGEGTFADIYKFTGYSLLPMIICLPIATGISYALTLNEQVLITLLQGIGFWGSGLFLVIGIFETHNYTFGQTFKNIILTIIFMILLLIICIVVVVMIDQIITFIEQLWREVKLRANWY